MAERPRELGDFKGWVNLRLNFSLKVRANIYEPLDRELIILELCRWKFSHKETL